MEISKYNLYKKKFGAVDDQSYKGKILLNNLSPRITSNTRVSYLLLKLEEIIQNWIDSVGYIRKKINYRVDLDDNDTIL